MVWQPLMHRGLLITKAYDHTQTHYTQYDSSG